jgi:hypothetical protein
LRKWTHRIEPPRDDGRGGVRREGGGGIVHPVYV